MKNEQGESFEQVHIILIGFHEGTLIEKSTQNRKHLAKAQKLQAIETRSYTRIKNRGTKIQSLPGGYFPHFYGFISGRGNDEISSWHERYAGYIVIVTVHRF